jgi:hypothetical protein
MPKRVHRDAEHELEEEAVEDSDQRGDFVDQDDDDNAAKRIRAQTSTALKEAKSLGKVIKVRRPYVMWLTDVWEEKKKTNRQPVIDAMDGPCGPAAPAGAVVPGGEDAAGDASCKPQVSFTDHIKAMGPQWKTMTDEQKLPWVLRSQEDFQLQRKQMAKCGIKIRNSQVQAQTKAPPGLNLLQEVAESSSFGGRGLKVGNFHVRDEAPLGAGSFGQVFQAVHSVTGQKAALKIFGNSTGALDSMKREVEIYQTVQAVTSLHDDSMAGTSFFLRLMGYSASPVPWICLEDGGMSIRILIKKGGWNADWTYPVANQLRLALQHMHGAGLAHLDVKPANLVLDVARMSLRIIDMGMTEQWIGEKLPKLRYETYVTELYRPPELFHDDCDQIDRSLLPYADWQPC